MSTFHVPVLRASSATAKTHLVRFDVRATTGEWVQIDRYFVQHLGDPDNVFCRFGSYCKGGIVRASSRREATALFSDVIEDLVEFKIPYRIVQVRHANEKTHFFVDKHRRSDVELRPSRYYRYGWHTSI